MRLQWRAGEEEAELGVMGGRTAVAGPQGVNGRSQAGRGLRRGRTGLSHDVKGGSMK